VRLNRYLASCGIGSRRAVEPIIQAGRVTINGEICTDLSRTVSEDDIVRVDGRPTETKREQTVLFFKPKGLLCTRSDPQGRETIYDALPGRMAKVPHVGRLDKESEGLLILTNDGILAAALTHPSGGVEKEYLVTLDQAFDPKNRSKLLEGFEIEGGFAKAEFIRQQSPRRLKVILKQGLKRQIRLMFDHLGYRVTRLVRVRIGTLDTANLKPGKWRPLSSEEIKSLIEPPKKSR
jgi:23S rRNA pseudouridine2605 synthase